MATKIALCGFGKIARDQHLPAINASPAFELVAIADPAGGDADVPSFPNLAALLESVPEVEAVAMCQPPQFRFADALAAIAAGKQVLLEKPPAPTLAAAEALATAAQMRGTTLFAAWHSRFAPGVEPAHAWLAGKAVQRATITWKEDVRVWHPGQRWIWEAGGFGVFDPGINALSIATRLLPGLFVEHGRLEFPSNCQSPMRGEIALRAGEVPVAMALDFLQEGPQTWDIVIETDGGTLRLGLGGAKLWVDDVEQPLPAEAEYPALYAHFAALIAAGASDVDLAPLTLVADAYMRCERAETAPFQDG